MKKHYLFIDESGGKGYADNRERFPGELGVIAGYLIPDVYIKIYRDEIEGCLSNIESSGKIHIAEMEDKREVRGKVFETFGRLAIPWMYEAIFVEGFYQSEFCEGRGGCRSHTELLHAKIFIGLMLKVFASLHKFKELGVELVVVSDNLDKGGRPRKLSATPDLSGTVLPLCPIPNSALKSARSFSSVKLKASPCAALLA